MLIVFKIISILRCTIHHVHFGRFIYLFQNRNEHDNTI